jgi:glycosyltransferase involved in cell wall biosynthesis
MASIFIDLAAQFTGDKAFKKADSATDKLSKNVKNLGKALGVTLGVGAILAFGKAAVKAAAEDEKAQKQLALALKNVGLGRDVAASEEYINKLSREFGVVDDLLRPSYQQLAVATQDTAQSQKLLQLALDISASTGKELSSVTSALSKAYLGNNTALSKLGINISKAELKTGKFDDIVNKLAKTFKGAASASVNTFSGKMARLTVSIDNAKEILGKGLIDSVMILTDSANITELQTKIENFATSASENMKKLAGIFKENETLIKSILAILAATYVSTKIIVGIGALINAIVLITKTFKALRAMALTTAIAEMFALNPYGAAAMVAGMVALIGITIKGVDALTDAYNNAGAARDYALDPKKYDNAATAFDKQFKGQEKLVKGAKILTIEEIKQLNAKKLQLAIDKAKLALGKGDDVFNMEKIQLAAAELNQAQLLGKVTSQAQLLQISNDLARLNVKQSILDLEDAIASKDIKAIEAGTAKLNGDLKILGALTNQELKLRDIESILKDIVPKDLINLANLDAALAKLRLLGSGIITPMGSPTPTGTSTPTLLESLAAGSFAPVVGGGYSSTAGNYASSGFPGSDRGYSSSGGNTIVVNTGIGDPNAIAEAIDQVLRDATDRGTLRVAS